MTRIYYWIDVAPKDRPGGPWWYQDFATEGAKDDFIKQLKPVCQKMMRIDREATDMPRHLPIRGLAQIYPPEDAVEL